MAKSDQYVTLMTSLPYPGPLFGAKQTPLSLIKLEQRLQMLTEEDGALLQRIINLVQWRRLPMGRSDTEFINEARALVAQLDDGLIKDIVEWRLEFRTVVAALRRRHQGEPAPGKEERWGYGRWVQHIVQNWGDPVFRLDGVYPWLREANQLLNNDDAVGLERLLLGTVWDHLGRFGAGHYFDFEAVVVYVARWNVIDRWTRYDNQAAAQRFQKLVEAGLGDYGSLLH